MSFEGDCTIAEYPGVCITAHAAPSSPCIFLGMHGILPSEAGRSSRISQAGALMGSVIIYFSGSRSMIESGRRFYLLLLLDSRFQACAEHIALPQCPCLGHPLSTPSVPPLVPLLVPHWLPH